ncbi:porin [Advenella sp. S44]|uniref:porin n=1 Tax=Advenella sp. S44 TaxID=1982755 RepID=UPI000C2A1AB1|nr:porin [Advenella sp. S44]PJX22978.1 porin [Advenella sp. S44]
MKKALQSIVLLGAATGAAQAATSVTLYGLVDGGIAYTQTKISNDKGWEKNRNVGFVNGVKNGNRWGLKGTEDLGNGTSAIFQIESGFDLGTGEARQGGKLFGRKAIIGLTGDSWGTLTLGRQYNVADDVVSGIDPFGTGVLQAGIADGAFGDAPSARMDNSFKYMSPDFAGFKFGIAYAGKNEKKTEFEKFDRKGNWVENFGKRDTSNWISTGLGYDNGPVSFGVSYDRFRTKDRSWSQKRFYGKVVDESEQLKKSTTHAWNLFGAYDFEVVKLHLGYGEVRGIPAAGIGIGLNSQLADEYVGLVKDEFGNTHRRFYTETPEFRQKSWMAGLSAPVGDTGTVLFSYQGNRSRNKNEAFDSVKGKLNIFSLGYVQNLSKRTSLYAAASYGVGRLKYKDDETKEMTSSKLKSTLVGLGLQHRF